MTSPTARTLAALRAEEWTAQVVERWNAFARVRVDLFGCIDVLAVRPGAILAVQATSGANVAARVAKSKALPALRTWLEAGGRFEVWGWAKRGRRGEKKVWTARRKAITLADLEPQTAADCESRSMTGNVVPTGPGTP